MRRPDTLAKSLAIGAPADGDGSVKIIRDTRGSAASVTDDEIREAATLLATTEGVLVEPAGGVVVATAKQLASRGVFHPGETVVLYLTGNGYKGGPEESALGPVIAADADAFRLAYEEVLA